MGEVATEEALHNPDNKLSSPVNLCIYILGIWTPADAESHSNGTLDDNDNRVQPDQQYTTEDDEEKQRLLPALPRTRTPQFSGTTIFCFSPVIVLI